MDGGAGQHGLRGWWQRDGMDARLDPIAHKVVDAGGEVEVPEELHAITESRWASAVRWATGRAGSHCHCHGQCAARVTHSRRTNARVRLQCDSMVPHWEEGSAAYNKHTHKGTARQRSAAQPFVSLV